MSAEYKIDSINDVLAFDDERFARFLTDFVTWRCLTREAVKMGAESRGMTWVDDDKPGQIHSIHVTVPETGGSMVIPGPAWGGE